MTLAIGEKGQPGAKSLATTVRRQSLPAAGGKAGRTLDVREKDICHRIGVRVSEVIDLDTGNKNAASIRAIRDAFDEFIVAQHVQEHHGLQMQVGSLLNALHTLSEQTYENKSLTFGCILDPAVDGRTTSSRFPADFLTSKRYKALSDGFRTAYWVAKNGVLDDFVDLEALKSERLTEKHYYPDWAEPMARASRRRRCGVALSRQGDILVFDEGTLRFTYRYGCWQYWNHSHLVNLLRDRARAQKVSPGVLGRVVGAIYRAALDVSFRRCGGLFIVLHNRKKLHDVVGAGDAIGDLRRDWTDQEFDVVLQGHNIQTLPRAVTVELASLDGAVVLDNSGRILAYGAILQPKKTRRLPGVEGSRTKAAIAASRYGLAVKISADGDITIYHDGKEFIHMGKE